MVKDKYIISEIVEITGKKAQTIRERLSNIEPVGTVTVNHNQTKVYAFSSLPKDYQEKILAADSPAQPINKTSHIPEIPKENKIPAAGIIAESMFTNCRQASNPAGLFQAVELPEKAKEIALARWNLLELWKQYRNAHQGFKFEILDEEFLRGYNSGIMYPQIYGTLGEISRSTLYNWEKMLAGSDYTKLAPGWYNPNAGKPELPEYIEKLIMALLLTPDKLKIGAAIRLAKWDCHKTGLAWNVSDMTIRRYVEWYRKHNENIWILKREGEKALKDKCLPYITRDVSMLEVGECIVADGHRLNFEVMNPFTGKPCRATIVGYIDWKSWCLIGYEIMIEENTQCIASAFRNAVMYLGKVPKIAYQDNGKAFRAKYFTGTKDFSECAFPGLFARVGTDTVFSMPYNARAKVIERFWQEFQETFERLMPSFTGACIDDKPAWRMRNEKLHKAEHINYLPTIQEAISWIEEWRRFHEAQPCPHVSGQTIGQVLNSGKGAGVDMSLFDEMMMAEKAGKIYRNGVKFLGEYYYDEALFGYQAQITFRYSLFDLSNIKVYTARGQFICVAKRMEKCHPLASISGTIQDVETLSRSIKLQKKQAKETRQAAGELTAQFRKVSTGISWGNVTEERKTVPAVTDETIKQGEIIEVKNEPKEMELKTDISSLYETETDEKPIFGSRTEKEIWEAEQLRKKNVA